MLEIQSGNMACKVIAALLLTALVVVVWAEEKKDCSHIHWTPFSVRKPVCGSDKQTYMNRQHLDYEKCMNHPDLTYVSEGYCDPEEGKRVEEEHRKFMAEYAKRIKQALKEGRRPDIIADLEYPDLDNYPDVDEDEPVPAAPPAQNVKSSRKQ